jgi:hypothetical protein
MDRRFALWSLVGAVALAASLAAHALQLTLENAHVFGQIRSAYAHGAQGPMALTAFALALFGAILLVRRAVSALDDRRTDPDWLLPALTRVRDLGAWRCIGVVLGVQLSAFCAGELIEQAASSYRQFGFGAFIGASHPSAAVVQLAVGIVAAALLWLFAREACRQVRAIARIAEAIIVWLARPPRARIAPALRALSLLAAAPAPPLLSLRIANRPPPSSTISFA